MANTHYKGCIGDVCVFHGQFMKPTLQAESRNQILGTLDPSDFGLLDAHLAPVELRVPQQLEFPNKPIDHVYFIESGFASVVANSYHRSLEIGLIGREGMTGLAIVMGHDRSPNETYMQVAGKALRISVAHLQDAIGQSTSLHRSLLRYGHSFYIEATQTALTNARYRVEQRLARWLLMAHDRIDGDELYLTHEFLSLMIGVRRASITETLRILAEDDLISMKRGAIAILDRVRLQKATKGTYTPRPLASSSVHIG
jgi:CRP-like cAMP-binding protein